ncbi:hypothetical protein A1Q2_01169 [Trichosporon asahii var. asahii CBS 8904]|uniref:Uncharacterized protein n=2 Tax=Trichosporon asahii var. asahii TaxID=189963 RepID=K1W6H1_TRIAC|nr:hypothetical protein A1Q1_04945 [Trichosporon asahii var. asahii CBS 2479]EJT46456.1 hypothetical protein A1Q1_04945 [Trichosporon asahii var. asahii CBS 2479]EKD04518.1 hypothetical protein A1Q2_01169 [Trichosporon asahii var. asahii CBS 8904]
MSANSNTNTNTGAQGQQRPPHHHLTSQQLDELSADAAEFPEVEAPKQKPVVGYGDLPNITRVPTEKDHENVAKDTLDQMVATLETDKAQKGSN